MNLLPEVTGIEDYRPFFDQTAIWEPAMAAICREQRLQTGSLERIPEGSGIVFACGEVLIKLLPPFWRQQLELDLLGLKTAWGQLPVTTPELLGTGELEGWGYLLTRRVPGIALKNLWRQLSPQSQSDVMRQLGELIKSVQSLDIISPCSDWQGFVRSQLEGFGAAQQAKGLDPASAEAFAAALAEAVPALPQPTKAVFLHSDLTDEHLLMGEHNGKWQIKGLIDFGDLMAGEALYELAAPCTLLTGGRPELRRALLRGYGGEVGEEQLLAVQLLHRFCFLKALLKKSGPEVADFRACFCRV